MRQICFEHKNFTSSDEIYCVTSRKTIFCRWQIASLVIKFNLLSPRTSKEPSRVEQIIWRVHYLFTIQWQKSIQLLGITYAPTNVLLTYLSISTRLFDVFSRFGCCLKCWAIWSDSAMIENGPIKKDLLLSPLIAAFSPSCLLAPI